MDVTIVDAMLRFVNEWPDKPTTIELDSMGKFAPAMMLQQLAGTVISKRYVDGSFIGNWPFAIYARTYAGGDAERLDVVKEIKELAAWMAEALLPDIGDKRTAHRIEMTSYPSLSARYEDGTDEYQAIFALNYKEET